MTHRPRFVLTAVLLAALLAGCASADKNSPPAQTTAKVAATANTSSTASSSMAGMNMGNNGVATEVPPSVNGIKPVASQELATATWQGMKIEARTMTPTTFVLVTDTSNGTKETVVRPTKKTSFHLMIMLDDEHTGVPIPYASVWATITTMSGKVVFDEQQWPMLSAYMGPHYGNNVTLPGPGHYILKLLISPPAAARHLEYKNVWLTKHTVTEKFDWNPPS